KITENPLPQKIRVSEHVEKKEEKPITISVRDDVKEMPKASENVRIAEISKKEKDAVEKQETPKRGRSGRKKMEQQQGQSITGIKRRSATITPEEPQVKKKSTLSINNQNKSFFPGLSDSDLISIPSSTAVVVDTELIAAENEHISIENLPKFAEKSDSQFASSIWNSPADAQLLEEVKKTASRKERKLFGVPLSNVSENKTMINVWVDNVDPNMSDKDVFSNDLRRMMAQDKKARIDGKAGYGVRQ
uniref:Uncharacterized protein n=1 Tax=Caenorhabditis japonica TaxID=281687 RepID=A0A8R1EWN2_CAEJA